MEERVFTEQTTGFNWFEARNVEVIEYGCVNKEDNPQPITEEYFLIPIGTTDKGRKHTVMPIYSKRVLDAWDNFRCLFDNYFSFVSEFHYKCKCKAYDDTYLVKYWLDWEHGVAHEWKCFNN